MLILNPPTISIQNGTARISCHITGAIDYDLWFAVDEAYAGFLDATVLDGFLVAVLMRAMTLGEDIQLLAPMSSRLYYNLSHYFITALKSHLRLKPITLHPDSLTTATKNSAKGVLMGFSGGVDSFFGYYDHTGNRAPAEYALTHLCYNNVGSHGQKAPEDDRNMFFKRAAILRRFAEVENKPFLTVDSNLDSFLGINFEATYMFCNVAVAMILQNGIGKYIFSSGLCYADTSMAPAHSTGTSEPVLLPLLSTEKLECILSGVQYPRTEKTAFITEVASSRQFLDVCVMPLNAPANRVNCSHCRKCLFTQMTLDVLGKLGEYGDAFDIALYRRFEKLFMIETLTSIRPLQKEVTAFIKEHGFPVPRMVRFLTLFLPDILTRHVSYWLIPRLFRRPKITACINAVLSF